MKIAIPIADGKLCMHFGHSEKFAILEVDENTKTVLSREDLVPPPHQPGLLPPWVAEKGANLVIAGGMGQRAVALFNQQGIKVIVGVPSDTPEKIATDYLTGTLKSGDNVCDH